MHETILRLPHAMAGVPVFGFGLALAVLIAALIGRVTWLIVRTPSRDSGNDVASSDAANLDAAGPDVAGAGSAAAAQTGGTHRWQQQLLSEIWAWVIAAAAIIWVLPNVELRNIDGDPVGVAIRGYGVFLLSGVVSAIALAVYRGRRRGIDPDAILAMAPWAFFGGIAGARLFYVIQYRDRFIDDSIVSTIGNMLRFTEGGLVVYGSFIGGGLGVLIFLIRHRLPILRLGDVIVPCLFLGVFFGRMGCLMHGCCWGGRCDPGLFAAQFPAGSPVYYDQMADGSLVGLDVHPVSRRIESIQPGSPADGSGLQPGQTIVDIRGDLRDGPSVRRDIPIEEVPRTVIVQTDSSRHRFTPDQLPRRSLPVRPAQLISSISALMLCLALCAIPDRAGREDQPVRGYLVQPGTVMWAGFAGYAAMRFGLEWIRVDEAGQFGTSLSISQWVSVLVGSMAIIGYMATRWYNRRRSNLNLDNRGNSAAAAAS